jgi:hypothetical protein
VGCLLALVAAISPRLALFLLWVFTDRLTIAFRSGWEGLIGFLLLPYTTLFFALVYAPGKGVDGFGSSSPSACCSTSVRSSSGAGGVAAAATAAPPAIGPDVSAEAEAEVGFGAEARFARAGDGQPVPGGDSDHGGVVGRHPLGRDQ